MNGVIHGRASGTSMVRFSIPTASEWPTPLRLPPFTHYKKIRKSCRVFCFLFFFFFTFFYIPLCTHWPLWNGPEWTVRTQPVWWSEGKGTKTNPAYQHRVWGRRPNANLEHGLTGNVPPFSPPTLSLIFYKHLGVIPFGSCHVYPTH